MLTLTDFRIADHTLQTMPRLAALRQSCLSARAEVCIERAHYVTAFLQRKHADDSGCAERIHLAKPAAGSRPAGTDATHLSAHQSLWQFSPRYEHTNSSLSGVYDAGSLILSQKGR